MVDQYKEVTKVGYGSRIVNSIKGIGFGLLLFFASFGVLYYNEGRVNKADIASEAIEIDDMTAAPAEAAGQLVAVSGTVTTTETVGDGLYLLPGDYLAVSRSVEMYAWIEESSSTTETNLGGSETTETTYSYKTDWTSMPASSSSFKQPEGHQNPSMNLESMSANVETAKIGMYNLEVSGLQLPGYSPLTLNDQVLKLDNKAKIAGQYVYVPAAGTTGGAVPNPMSPPLDDDFFSDTTVVETTETTTEEDDFFGETGTTETTTTTTTEAGAISNPKVGDLRISYSVLKNNVDGTVMGKLDGDKITTYVAFDEDNAQIYRLFTGSKDEAVAQLNSEHNFITWILRIAGFLMMWFGLSALFAPISVLLDVVPFLGSLSRAAVGTITFIAALLMSVVTIVVSMIVHSLLAVVIVLVVGLIIFIYFIKFRGKKKKEATNTIKV